MTTQVSETALQKEQRLFRELFARLRDALLNRMFDLRPEKALRRSSYVMVLFIASGFIISFLYYSPSTWVDKIGNIFTTILSTTSTPSQLNASTNDLFYLILQIVQDPRVLQYLPLFLASFFIALQTAAMYLADVFELEDVSVAREFVNRVALSGSNETIRIKHGEIAEESRESPVYLIGGPGKVVVDLDSTALFERADGTPHIIGPTGKDPGGKATLEGFERFRHAVDIRDHYVELRDQDEKSKAVKSRSRDGIPIKATDVRLMFSIFRGNSPEPSVEHPYPYSRVAMEQIVYKAESRVAPELPNPSSFKFNWINNMIGLIRGRLGGFMSQHNLAEYLASIGLPEIEKVKQREETIRNQTKQLTQTEDGTDRKEIKPPPDFQARYKIKNLFAQFTEEFTNKARNSGVELHWIGVGTWESPINVVPEKHLEAWLLTQENLKNESPEQMKKIEQMEVVDKMKELIQKVPIAAFNNLDSAYLTRKSRRHPPRRRPSHRINALNSDDKIIPEEEMERFLELLNRYQSYQDQKAEDAYESEDIDHEMQALLLEFRKQFRETADIIMDKKEVVPQNILDAIRYIDNQIAHWAGRWPEGGTQKSSRNLPEPVVLIDQALGTVHIRDLPPNEKLRVGKTYTIQVDVLKDLTTRSIAIEQFPKQNSFLDIVIQADEMDIFPDWFHKVEITPHKKNKPPEFTVTPLKLGNKTITIQYYYKSHWLTQIKYQFEVTDA